MRDDVNPALPQDAARLIAAIATRQDRSAFAVLFGFYASRVKALLMRMGTPAELAEELAQETLLMVWRKAAYFDAERASASAWIFAIARNLRIDIARRDQRAKRHAVYDLVEPDAPEQPDRALDAHERDQRVRTALGLLPAPQMRVLELSFFEGQAHMEIARRLEIPLGTVKSRLRLAMARLREALGGTP